MLELGWTRPEIRSADPADVVGVRWGLFAQSLARAHNAIDIDTVAESIRDAEHEPSKATRLFRAKEKLAVAREARASLRRALLLDEPDDTDQET